VTDPQHREYLPGTEIEIRNADLAPGRIRLALFDFDGTLSLIREGWQQVMVPMMVDILAATPRAESREELLERVRDFVYRLTGKQTIYQMLQLVEEIEARGGTAKTALEYKRDYLDLLWARIRHRVEALNSGEASPEDYLVPGGRDILEALAARGIRLYLASGTDQPFVMDEAEALDVARYFDGGIYGALDNWEDFSKAKLLQKLVEDYELTGPSFVTFGDGYVEIEIAKEAGGIAVGVAANERERAGIDEWKRERLIGVGADIIVPDFREADRLMALLFGATG
jgi:phosphoglycolate phosphatase